MVAERPLLLNTEKWINLPSRTRANPGDRSRKKFGSIITGVFDRYGHRGEKNLEDRSREGEGKKAGSFETGMEKEKGVSGVFDSGHSHLSGAFSKFTQVNEQIVNIWLSLCF